MKYIILLLVLSSCGMNYHLNRAISLGANIKQDTVYKVVPFKFPGTTFTTTLQPLSMGENYIDVSDTLRIGYGDGEIKTKIKITLSKKCPEDCIEKIYVKENCPDVEGEVKTAIAVNNTITSTHGFWYYLRTIGIVTFVLGILFRHFWSTIITLLFKKTL